MADNRRLERVAGNLKKEISLILDRKVSDPDKGLVTISAVKVSPDLKIAKVYYTVFGDDAQKAKTKKALRRSSGFIRNELKPSIKSRWLPELHFYYDESIEYAQHINALIAKIHDDSDD